MPAPPHVSRRQFLAASGALPWVARRRAGAVRGEEGPANVLFLISDQHRASVAGYAGDAAAHTPHLDALAKESTRFSALYCQSPLCMASRQSLLTASYVHDHGAFRNWQLQTEGQRTLAHAFSDAGYATALIGKDHCNTTGFEHVETHDALAQAFLAEHPGASLPGADSYTKRKDDPDREFLGSMNPTYVAASSQEGPVFFLEDAIVERSLAYLSGLPEGRPFFLWASLVNPHPPLFPPAAYLDRFADADLPLFGSLEAPSPQHFELYVRRRMALGLAGITDDVLRNITRAYYASLAYADACIGRLLDGLRRQGYGRDTLIVYTSDHGELLGQHGLLQKQALYEGAVRVPGMLSLPGRIASGRVRSEVCEHVDLIATLFDLTGVEAGRATRGRSMRALLDASEAPDWEDSATSEMLADGVRRFRDFDPDTGVPLGLCWMLREGRYKLVWHVGAETRLYDLLEDPGEGRDLSREPQHKDRVQALRARLLERAPATWEVHSTGAREGRPNQGRKRNLGTKGTRGDQEE